MEENTNTHHNIHMFMNVYIDTKINGKVIEYNMSNSDIIRRAEQDDILHKYNTNIFFCCYKTVFEETDSIIILIAFSRLPGASTGSTAASELVMDMVHMLEKKLVLMDDIYYVKEIDSDDKSIGLLKIIKKIEG